MNTKITSLMLILLVGVVISGCVQEEQIPEEPLDVTIGLGAQPTAALLIIADEKGFFQEEGLNVIIKEYPSGKRALLDGLFAGEVDIVNVAEVPVVFSSFERKDFSIIASISSADSIQKIVARRDSGIVGEQDLAGKRIATQRASAVHFFLHSFLIFSDMSEEDINLSFMKAEELPNALFEGKIDAFSMREPYVSEAVDLLGSNAVVLSKKRVYVTTDTLVALNSFIHQNKKTLRRLLKALIKAEEFATQNSVNANGIVTQRLDASKKAVSELWPDLKLKVNLNPVLVLTMEDEAKWAIDNSLLEGEVPNYLDYIYFDALEEVKPEAVSIIH